MNRQDQAPLQVPRIAQESACLTHNHDASMPLQPVLSQHTPSHSLVWQTEHSQHMHIEGPPEVNGRHQILPDPEPADTFSVNPAQFLLLFIDPFYPYLFLPLYILPAIMFLVFTVIC